MVSAAVVSRVTGGTGLDGDQDPGHGVWGRLSLHVTRSTWGGTHLGNLIHVAVTTITAHIITATRANDATTGTTGRANSPHSRLSRVPVHLGHSVHTFMLVRGIGGGGWATCWGRR